MGLASTSARALRAHTAATPNAALRNVWLRIEPDEVRHAHLLQMALSGRTPMAGMGGPAMGQAGAVGDTNGMGHAGMMGQTDGMHHMEGMASGKISPGQLVVPTTAHMPEHRDRAAGVLQVAHAPVYVLDFGDGMAHRWYVQSELRLAPSGTQAGQTVPGATTKVLPH